MDIVELDERKMKKAELLRLVKERYWDILLSYPNVVGVGVGLKEKEGEKKAIPSIVVYVRKKYPEEKIKSEFILPKYIEGHPVDVKELPEIIALPFLPEGKDKKTEKWRPVIAGISVGHPCYDSQTRVLTEDGLKFFDELSPKDKIASLNPKTKELEFQHPLKIYHFPYRGEMIRIFQKHYDLLVTPNHYLYIKHRRWNDFKLLKANDVLSRYARDSLEFLCTANWSGKVPSDFSLPKVKCKKLARDVSMKDILKLCAWYISEGFLGSGYRVMICNSKSEALSEIEELVERLGFKSWREKTGHAERVTFKSKQLFTFLAESCGRGNRNKRVPKFIKELDRELIEYFLLEICRGDGHLETRGNLKGKPRYYCTSSERLANDICELAVKIGLTPKLIRRNEMFLIYFSHKETSPRLSHAIITKEEYNGFVHCVEVPNHVILVERNGRFIFSGNSITAGTLGHFARITTDEYGKDLKNKIVGVTNWHVAGERNCKKGDPMLQPAPYDGGKEEDRIGYILDFQEVKTTGSTECPVTKMTLRILNSIARMIGSRYRFTTVREVPKNKMDVAIFLLEEEVIPEIWDIGRIEGVVEGKLQHVVEKSGRTTCHTKGAVLEDIDWSGYVRYSDGFALLVNQYAYRGKDFSAGGDSGSSILLQDMNKIESLLFAGGEGWTIGTPYLKTIMQRFPIYPTIT